MTNLALIRREWCKVETRREVAASRGNSVAFDFLSRASVSMLADYQSAWTASGSVILPRKDGLVEPELPFEGKKVAAKKNKISA
jgi:hypothetical protein